MKTVLRFVTRDSDKDDGVIFGVLFKGAGLEPRTVYEIVNVLDGTILKKVGPSWLNTGSAKYYGCHLDSSVDQIIECGNTKIILTEQEYKSLN